MGTGTYFYIFFGKTVNNQSNAFWFFKQMEDLCEWIPVLEKIDCIILKHMTCISKCEPEKEYVGEGKEHSAKWIICCILRFLSALFRAARNKSFFLSFEVCCTVLIVRR